MKRSKLLVSFLAIAAFLVVLGTAFVSASDEYDITKVEVEDVEVYPDIENHDIGINAGETIKVEIWFTADKHDTDVRIEVELESGKEEVRVVSDSFKVIEGRDYKKTLTLKVPYNLKDELLDEEATLDIEIDGERYKTTLNPITLTVERPQYIADIKSISTPQTIMAGDIFPVEVVLKNIGFEDLDDVYVSVSIPALELESSAYFGDIVALECDEDDADTEFPWSEEDPEDNQTEPGLNRKCDEDEEDTVYGRLFLAVPFGVESGVYTLEVNVENDDTTSSAAKQISVRNEFESTVFVSGNDLWLVNPTNDLMGYRIVPESPASVDKSVVFIPAGSSETVVVNPNTEGAYSFNVNIFTMSGELVKTVAFTGEGVEEDTGVPGKTNPVVVLTVILAIIFLVLLIVLIVLIGKKPEKSEEFGESYY